MINFGHISVDYLRHWWLFKQANIVSQDVFVVSVPKSGNTWVRFILARALYPDIQIDLNNLQAYFPTAHRSTAEEIKKKSAPRYIKSHYPFFSLYPRSIYVYRDYRDVTVSAWYHVQRKGLFFGSFSEFLRHPLLHYYGTWADHVKKAFDYSLKYPSSICMLRYEDLKYQPQQYIRELLEFCGIRPVISVDDIIQLTSFETMKSQEQDLLSNTANSAMPLFFRNGKIGDWRNHFNEDDLQFLYSGKGVHAMMKRCGYVD